ncbi:MAG: hypothetical protein SAK29_15330 [Scytonema sp. PMC 1069.18]|nr:hypothetical protein [Scytonema sp. PMC 1069.18]MEC4883819.1 hypothetical protein [Scytonema sp. PMC 1070.18]
MSRITISDLSAHSNSFINELPETEIIYVNGGYEDDVLAAFTLGYGQFALDIAKILQTTFLKGLGILAIYQLVK